LSWGKGKGKRGLVGTLVMKKGSMIRAEYQIRQKGDQVGSGNTQQGVFSGKSMRRGLVTSNQGQRTVKSNGPYKGKRVKNTHEDVKEGGGGRGRKTITVQALLWTKTATTPGDRCRRSDPRGLGGDQDKLVSPAKWGGNSGRTYLPWQYSAANMRLRIVIANESRKRGRVGPSWITAAV